MRLAARDRWVDLAPNDSFVFLTGDVGFGVLEPLRDAMGNRFINAGLAEQNMVSVAAGMASQGIDAWVYSIAPFCYARPFEQIRNDVCLHDLPVKLVGNGGGYGYGAMGATHHALEDYGSLLALQNMHVFVPTFSSDLAHLIPRLAAFPHPAYLRLGRCERPESFEVPAYAPWRKLLDGEASVVVGLGPLVGSLLEPLGALARNDRPQVWALSELPLEANPIPHELIAALEQTARLCVVEEHVAQGGMGQGLAHLLLKSGVQLEAFEHVCAQGYPSATYGSQQFHRRECGLDPGSIQKTVEQLQVRP